MTTFYGKEALAVLTSNALGYDELEDGETRKYSHVDCPAGEDRRGRLGVKNVDGAYMWHCFNCGDSGYYRPRETVRRMREQTEVHAAKSTRSVITMPSVNDYDYFDDRGQRWLAEYGIDKHMCYLYDVEDTDEGIMLPIMIRGERVGYQIRRYDKKPKYLTYTTKPYAYTLGNDEKREKTLVVVEDLLSSYKLNSVGYSTLCLLGTKLNTSDFSEIVQGDPFVRVVLWLDDDEAGHMSGMKLFKELSPLFRDIVTMFNEQPKEIERTELIGMEL